MKKKSVLAWIWDFVSLHKMYFVLSLIFAFVSVLSGFLPYFFIGGMILRYKVGDKVKSRKTGFYGVVTDVDITPNKLFVKVKLMLNDREVEIPKSVLDYVTPEEWEFVKRMEERD